MNYYWILLLFFNHASVALPVASKEVCIKAMSESPTLYSAKCVNTHTGDWIR